VWTKRLFYRFVSKAILTFFDRNFLSLSAVDATLTSGANGEDIVDACIEKLNQLAIFPNDFGLMHRIAKVETDFGNAYGTASPSRGIWQVWWNFYRLFFSLSCSNDSFNFTIFSFDKAGLWGRGGIPGPHLNGVIWRKM